MIKVTRQLAREQVVKAFGLAVMLGVVVTLAPARALEVSGTSGFLGEWEVTATVTETASGRIGTTVARSC